MVGIGPVGDLTVGVADHVATVALDRPPVVAASAAVLASICCGRRRDQLTQFRIGQFPPNWNVF